MFHLKTCFWLSEAGCKPLDRANGKVITIDAWASASLTCQSGFELAGPELAYCNGTNWDRPLGDCRETQNSTSSCDFENANICGWSPTTKNIKKKINTNYNWIRTNGVDRLNQMELKNGEPIVRSGPINDHTTMEPRGFYLVAQSTNWNEHLVDKAIIMSPMYPGANDTQQCFQFYLYMDKVEKIHDMGNFAVFLKPESKGVDEVLTDSKCV